MSTAVPDAPSVTAKSRPKKWPKADDTRRLRIACDVLKAGSDPTRAKILLILAEGERKVFEITAAVELTQPAVSHHLSILKLCRLVEPERRGKNNLYSVTEKGKIFASLLRTPDG